jgi:hypothetical protein
MEPIPLLQLPAVAISVWELIFIYSIQQLLGAV